VRTGARTLLIPWLVLHMLVIIGKIPFGILIKAQGRYFPADCIYCYKERHWT